MLYSEQMKQICEHLGVDPGTCSDGLYSTLLQTICDACGSGSGGGITPSGEIAITENGTYDVAQYASASVNVASGGGGGDIDALIEGSAMEVNSNAKSVSDYALYMRKTITEVNFPLATSIGECAFRECAKLTRANIPLAISIGTSAFRSCSVLTEVNLPSATSIGAYSFQACQKLTKADFPLATSVAGQAFRECSALTEVNFPVATSIGESAFYTCKALTKANIPLATSIISYAFYYCTALTAFVLRSETVCTLANSNAFTGSAISSGKGYIYVPAALVDSYKSATNWSTYAARFRALEDYTVDGTTTGELDETKI